MSYREATEAEILRFDEAVARVKGCGGFEIEINKKKRRLIKRESLEGNKAIGGLGEKTLHLALKYFFQPSSEYHEIKIGRHYADILYEGSVIEIQTKSFCSFRKKLEAVSREYPVTVVHPIIKDNRIYKIDSETGEVYGGKMSPVHKTVYNAFEELVYIRELLSRDSLCFLFPVLECESYKAVYDKNRGRRGYLHYDTIPTRLVGFYEFDTAYAFATLLPENLGDEFTIGDIAEKIKKKYAVASSFVNTLMYLDIVKKDGKKGRRDRYVYGESY